MQSISATAKGRIWIRLYSTPVPAWEKGPQVNISRRPI
jgi:hypothetical protein